MNIVSLIGARPQFIKEAVIHKELKKKGITETIINSDQHYDANMSDVFFNELEIKPADINLNIGSGTHGAMTGKIMIAFEEAVLKIKPDMILVYGDTNTTLAGAIVASKLKIPVAHIEAGIRMLPKDMPEEINRVLTDRISDYMFCPTDFAVENLKKEGLQKGVYHTGDIMYDLYKIMEPSFKYDVFNTLNLEEQNFVLVTLHRDYNVDNKEKLEEILKQLNKINEELPIVFPLHPRTKNRINEFGLKKYVEKIKLTEPLDYLNLMGLMKKSAKVVTDSGGLQKEAYFAKKRACVVMPDTGWIELINNKWNNLSNPAEIYDKTMNTPEISYQENIYGDGFAGKKIVDILVK